MTDKSNLVPSPVIAGADHRFFSRSQVLDSGLRDRDIKAALRSKEWERLRWGYYSPTAIWNTLTPEERHVVVLRTIADRYQGRVVFTHHSSAVVHRFAVYDQDLAASHVRRLDGGTSRREAGIVHHSPRPGSDDDIEVTDGLLVTNSATCLWEAGITTSVEGGLVSFSDALHQEAVTRDELIEVGARFGQWPGSRKVRLALQLSDGLAESPGEARGLYLFWLFAIPRPVLQHEVYSSSGVLLGRSDYWWEEYRLLGEFDGMVKYRRSWRQGEDPTQVVEREKVREDRMRDEAHGMVRYVWKEFDPSRRAKTAERTRHALEQSRRLYTRYAVHIPL
jgi:hypothetical protein